MLDASGKEMKQIGAIVYADNWDGDTRNNWVKWAQAQGLVVDARPGYAALYKPEPVKAA